MKKIWVILFLVIATPMAILAYYSYQATKLPTWYTSEQEPIQSSAVNKTEYIKQPQLKPDEIIRSKTKVVINQNNKKNVQINLNEADINDLVISEVTKKTRNKELPEAVKGIKTTIQDGKIESGAVVNISKLPTNQLRESEKATITQLTKTFPFLENQEVYIGVVRQPSVENGQLKLDDNTEIKVGNLSFTTSDISNKLGIPKEQLEKRINLELNLGRLKVEDVQLVDNQAVIKGSSNNKIP